MQIEQNQDMKMLFEMAAEAAVRGAKSTEEIAARMGRAGTVGDRSIGYPDAGAHALGVIFTEISQEMKIIVKKVFSDTFECVNNIIWSFI